MTLKQKILNDKNAKTNGVVLVLTWGTTCRGSIDNVKEINGERIVYTYRKANNDRNFLLPIWEISYTDKNGSFRKSYFDAV